MNWKAKLAALGLVSCLPLVSFYEGLRVKAYLDPVGIPTICYGHTGPEVKLGLSYTLDQCEELLAKDLIKAENTVRSCVTAPLTDNQRSAFTSFAFNVGPGTTGVKDGFCRLKSGKPSTMLTLINQGRAREACGQFKYWANAGGVVLQGLVKRRMAEEALCLQG